MKKCVPVRQISKTMVATTKIPISNNDIHDLVKPFEESTKRDETENDNARESLNWLRQDSEDMCITGDNSNTPYTQTIFVATPAMQKAH